MADAANFQPSVIRTAVDATILSGQTESNSIITRGLTVAALETDLNFPDKNDIEFLGKFPGDNTTFKSIRDIAGHLYAIKARTDSIQTLSKYDFSGVDEIKLRLKTAPILDTVIHITATLEG